MTPTDHRGTLDDGRELLVTTHLQAAEDFDAAADSIEAGEWARFNPTLCAIGHLDKVAFDRRYQLCDILAAQVNPDWRDDPVYAGVLEHPGGSSVVVMTWNDRHENKQPVLDGLRLAAKSERRKADAIDGGAA